VLVLTAGCGKNPADDSKKETRTEPKAASPIHKVTLVHPKRQDLRHTLGRPGYIEAFEETPIYAKLAGYVRTVQVDIGDTLKVGDLLAELRIPELAVELVQKEALVNQARANLESARARIKVAEAAVVKARADVKRWDVEQRRQQRMVRGGTLDRQSLDAAEAQLEASRAAVIQARAEVVKDRADVLVAERNVEVARANKDYVAALLRYTRLEAPYPAVVVKRNVNTDDFVQPAAGSGGKGEPLFVLARTDKGVRIFVDVPETAATTISAKTQATVRVRALPGLEVAGQVRRSSWALDPRSRTLRTEIDVPQPGKLRPGMYAYVTLTTLREKVWTLPASAVVVKDDEAYCFRVEKSKAVKTPLQIGLSNGKRVEVLRKRLEPARAGARPRWEEVTGTEPIVQGNADQLTDGQEVKVEPVQ
jgi:multidrug efflux pump subunit AcrA (membrane-fusion protein)